MASNPQPQQTAPRGYFSVAAIPAALNTPLSQIKGIDPVLADRLLELGIETPYALTGLNADKMADNIGHKRVDGMIAVLRAEYPGQVLLASRR